MSGSLMRPVTTRTIILLLLPTCIQLTMVAVFRSGSQVLGNEAGYLLGFLLYWLAWCLLFPRIFLGREGFSSLLKDRQALFHRRNLPAALLWGAIILGAAILYVGDLLRAPLALILAAIPLATINGLCEELLWRGVYVRSFPGNPWLGVLFPAASFAIWHFAPLLVFPEASGIYPFVLSTFFLGLGYGFVAFRTGSSRWTAISHSLAGILALSGMLAPSLLKLVSAGLP